MPFILGVGAQKAGTTWLHRYIAPGGPMKEFHVWNTLYGPIESRITTGFDFENPLRLAMLADTEVYFDHFADGGADVTPSYAALSKETFEFIREGFDRRGVEVRPVFIMREPAERLWSAWRMYRRRGLTDLTLEAYARGAVAKAHGSYERTAVALEVVFDRVWFGFYESLFNELGTLSHFLGVPLRPEMAEVRHNSSPDSPRMPASVRKMIEAEYCDTYRFCFDRFPQAKELWQPFNLAP